MSDSEDSEGPNDFSAITARDPSFYITQYLSTAQLDNQPPLTAIAKLITSRELSLLKLVQLLGDYLTAADESLRTLSLGLLSRVLRELASQGFPFNGNDLKVLLKFLISKLDDEKGLAEALIGITALLSKNIDNETLKDIIGTVKEKYPEIGNPSTVRYQAFLFLDKLFDFARTSLGKQFIELFIHVASNEKDPRNLLLSFELNSKISRELNTEAHHQDLFDLLYCYFPVNFKPPKNDPYNITQDQLKENLAEALASNALFQNDLLENNLENFSNSNYTYKYDSLMVLNLFFKKHKGITDDDFLKLFQVLKFEVVNLNLDDDEDDREMKPMLLSLLQSLVTSLSQSQTSTLYQLINDQFFKELNFNNKVLFKNFLFLTAIASTTQQNFNYVFKLTVTELFHNLDHNISSKRELIKIITLFLDCHSTLSSTEENQEEEEEDELINNKEKLLIFLSDTLMSSSPIEVSIRNLSLIALRGLTSILSLDEQSLVISYYFETLKTDKNEHIFESCLKGINAITGGNDVITNELQGLVNGLFQDGNDDSYIFKILRGIKDNKTVEGVIDLLLGKFIHLSSGKDEQVKLRQSFQIVENLIQIITESHPSYQIDLGVFTNLIGFIVNGEEGDLILDLDLFDKVTDLIKLFVINMSSEDQGYLYRQLLQVYYGSQSEIFETLGIWGKKTDVKIYLVLKCNAGLGIKLFSDAEDIGIQKLVTFINTTEFNSEFVKLGYLQLLCLLVNKFDIKEIPSLDLSSIRSIECHTWITKALLLKMSSLSQTYVDQIIGLLSQSDKDYSSLFQILTVDLPIFATTSPKIKINNRRLLYKQKFYGIVIPQLIELYTTSSDFKYLKALLTLMNDRNTELLAPYIESIFQIFLVSKDKLLEQKEVVKLEIFLRFVKLSQVKIPSFEKHLNSILTLFQSLLSMNRIPTELKITILENINEFIKLNPVEVVKLKTPVLRMLQGLSNDGSRKVRKLNVDVRQQWYELGIASD